jgi:glycosyltransferase involved in cell wall biosynthesis
MTERLSDICLLDELPLVTVAMPIYNAGKYLRFAVLSIVNQTFTNWELLIIDDGSTDNALQDIADIKDKRIRILCDGINRGLAARLNEAIDLAKGHYFARMDGDDVSYPERFARQLSVLQNEPELDLVATRAITIDEGNQALGLFPYAISHKEICAKPWRGFYFPHPTWMGKIEWFRNNRYKIPGPFCCEDQELLLRSYSNSRLATLDDILFAYRIRSKVGWQKLSTTRCAVFINQLKCFIKFKQYQFLILAAIAFVGKLSIDFLKKMKGTPFRLGADFIPDTEQLKWHKVFDSLKTSHTVP